MAPLLGDRLMDAPETRYAKSGDAHIAYQVFGEGPLGILFLSGFFANVEHNWSQPLLARFLRRLGSFARVITMDMRGTGLSDRSDRLPTFERQMDDVLAVQDAAGVEQTAVLSLSQAGPLAILFAATHPGRTTALVLYSAYATLWATEDYPWGRTPEWMEQMAALADTWGTGGTVELVAPTAAHDPEFRRWWAESERLVFTPGGLKAFLRMQYGTDVRHVLQAISVPSLILHREGDTFRDAGNSRYIAEHIPDARYVELEGVDHAPFVGDADAVLDEVQEFLTGVRPAPEPDRVLSTVMFTDIVDSTRRAVELGDHRWREFLADHDSIVRRELSTHRGREVKTTGDGFLATFDGPARGIRCATAIRDAVRARELEIRAGLHTGEIELIGEDVAGIGVHLAARVMAQAGAGEVLVSSTVKDLVAGSGIDFEDRGAHALKGVPGEWRLFAVAGDAGR